jgi:hypothetical protein
MRVPILIVSALLTGCAACPVPGTHTPTGKDWFPDMSTCECNYLFQITQPDKDVRREDDQTSRVIARVPRPNGATYSFLVNKDQAALVQLAKNAPSNMVPFKGCRAPDVKEDEDFVMNVGTPIKKE